jgi:hypothetical protein
VAAAPNPALLGGDELLLQAAAAQMTVLGYRTE